MTARALARDGEAGEHYFQALGYETYRWGSHWDWKYRKAGTQDPWMPANPNGLDLGDLASFIADAVIAGGSTLAAIGGGLLAAPSGPGAIAAGAASGGAAGAGLEAGREMLGSAAGIPGNIDPAQIALTGAGAAIAEPIGAVAGVALRSLARGGTSALKATSRITPEFAAKLIGVRAVGETTPGQVMMQGIKMTRGAKIPIHTAEQAGEFMRSAIRLIQKRGIPEVRVADRLVKEASASGTTANLSLAMKEIEEHALTPDFGLIGVTGKPVALPGATPAIRVARGVSPSLPKEASALIDHIRREANYFGDWATTPVQTAHEIKKMLQGIARGEGMGKLTGPSETYGRLATSAAAKTRMAVRDAMLPHDPGFNAIMKAAETKAREFSDWSAALRLSDYGMSGRDAATNAVRGMFGDSGTSYITGLNNLERAFMGKYEGQLVGRVIERARQAEIGRAIGRGGLGGEVPAFAATGGVRATALFGGGFGFMGGGPLGAVAGMVAGAELGSPRIMLGHTAPAASRLMTSTLNVTNRLAQMHLGGATRVLAQVPLTGANIAILRQTIAKEGSGSKGLARQDGPRPRRVLVIQ